MLVGKSPAQHQKICRKEWSMLLRELSLARGPVSRPFQPCSGPMSPILHVDGLPPARVDALCFIAIFIAFLRRRESGPCPPYPFHCTPTFAPDAAVRRANGAAERAALVCLRPRVRARRADNNRLIYHGDCRGLLSSRLLGPYILRYPLARLLASRRFHLISTTAADATTCSAPAWLSWHRPSPAFAASQISN